MSENKKKFEPIPEGEYVVTLDKAEKEPFKNGSGDKLSLVFKVAKGDHKDRLLFHDLPIKHKSPKAEKFGRKGADILLKAMGVEGGIDEVGEDMTSLADYVGDQVIAAVGIEKGTEYPKDGKMVMGNDRNKIVVFKTR